MCMNFTLLAPSYICIAMTFYVWPCFFCFASRYPVHVGIVIWCGCGVFHFLLLIVLGVISMGCEKKFIDDVCF